MKGVLFHQDNAPAHKSVVAMFNHTVVYRSKSHVIDMHPVARFLTLSPVNSVRIVHYTKGDGKRITVFFILFLTIFISNAFHLSVQACKKKEISIMINFHSIAF